MSSTIAIFEVLIAALYAHAAIYQLVMWWRRREGTQISLAMLAFGLGGIAVGNGLLAEATTQAAGAVACSVKYAGVAIATGGCFDYVLELAGRRTRRARVALQVFAWLSAALAAAGLWIDAGAISPSPTWGFAAAPDYPAPPLSLLGRASLAASWILAGIGAFILRGRIRAAGVERRVFASVVLSLVAGAHDLAITVASLRSVYVVEYVAYFILASASYAWLERFGRAGQELRARNREIEESYAELKGRQEELGRAQQLAAVGELASVMAHELRNPLSVIKNASAQLGRSSLPANDRQAVLDILDDEIGRLDRLIDNLLTFTKPIRIEPSTVSVSAVLERALARAPRRAGIDVSLPPDGSSEALIHVDAELCEQALLHVLENAFDAVSDRGTIRIEADGPDADNVRITISDSGPGMADAVLAKAKTPFFTTREQGTGLGLAIVERIMRAHGSTFDLVSEETSGTRVTLVFPKGSHDG